MSGNDSPEDRRLLARWIRATFAGWLLGVLFIMFAAMGADLMGMGDTDSQFMVGLGMGAGVGYGQGRVARRWLKGAGHWAWMSIVGMGVPFLAFDFSSAFWNQFNEILRLLLEVAISGLVVGLLQGRLLGRRWGRAAWWIPACGAGWTLAAATAAIGPVLGTTSLGRGFVVAVNLTTILSGGVVLGLVTGAALVWVRRS